jgi:hypothetical protein
MNMYIPPFSVHDFMRPTGTYFDHMKVMFEIKLVGLEIAGSNLHNTTQGK